MKAIKYVKERRFITHYLKTGEGSCMVAVSLFLCLSELLDYELFKKCYVGRLPTHVMIIKKEEDKEPEYIDFGFTPSVRYCQKHHDKMPKMLGKQTIIANILSNIGLDLLHSDKYEESAECFDKAIEINPNFYRAWYHKALALFRLGKYERMKELLDAWRGN